MSIEESVAKTAVGGASKILLAPAFLLLELIVALLPGMTLAVLIAIKRNPEFVSTFDHLPFGYRTKIGVGLLLCFVVGRVLCFPGRFLEKWFADRLQHDLKKNPDANGEMFKSVAVGVLLLPRLFGRSEALTYMMLVRTDCYFSLNTGLALLIAAAIPGDGILRLVELGSGLALAWIGLVWFKRAPKVLIALFGMSLAGEIEKLVPGGLPGLIAIALPLLTGKPNPPAPPAKPQGGDSGSGPAPNLPSG